MLLLFFFQAEDGIRDHCVTGVQTCALPIYIQGKISSDPDTKDSQVSVAAKDGKVTLSGSVKSPAAQQKIDQIAHEETGASELAVSMTRPRFKPSNPSLSRL